MSEEIYRPGLEGVIAGETNICSVEQGTLSYRGYLIEDLAEHSTFEETAHLLLYGELPTSKQLSLFQNSLMEFRPLPPALISTLRAIPTDVPMMEALRTTVSMAGHFDPVKGDGPEDLRRRSIWLLSTIAGLIAARYRLLNRKEPVAPKAGLSHAAQILYQCQGEEADPLSVKLLDLTLILYAEHEYNASTFAARVCASTLSDMVSAIVVGIGTLKGPLHGGANEASMQMLGKLGGAEDAAKWVRNAVANKEKIMGFGHRVYRHGDHRAKILEREMRSLARSTGNEKWLGIYDAVKDYMVNEKGIFPNVDYPCGLTYHLMGLPIDVYTPLFVASRTSGWCAHVVEQLENNRLIRPRSRYTGPLGRQWRPIAERGV